MIDRFSRQRDGTVTVELDEEERAMLGTLFTSLRELLLDTDDPSLTRLFPPAYANDPDRNAEYEVLTRDELLEKRLSAIDAVESSLGQETLTEDQALQWMNAINNVRLVLGTQLDVSEETELPDPGDPSAPALFLYSYLGYLLDELVTALSA